MRLKFDEELSFGGITSSYEDAKIFILPVPFEGTVSYGKGTSKGASAIIDASQFVELYDFESGNDFEDLKLSLLEPLDVSGDVGDIIVRVESVVGDILKGGKLPFMIGGEHSITAPAVRAFANFYGDEFAVIHIDAHADLRDEYGGNKNSHASVMARVREVALLLQLGIRSCSKEEAVLIEDERLAVLSPLDALDEKKLVSALQKLPDKIYLTFDVDALDPSIMPSTGTPEPGGFDWVGINTILDIVKREKKIVGGDIVELAPIAGFDAPDFLVAKLAFKLLYMMAGG